VNTRHSISIVKTVLCWNLWIQLALILLWAPPAVAQVDADETTLLQRAQAASDRGEFAEAEKLLRDAAADPDAPATDDVGVALEILRRIRLDYSLSPDEMLTKLRGSIPDATAEDVDRWRQQGFVQHRMIDGEIRYFKREPSNLFRFCKEAKERRMKRVHPAGSDFDLRKHVSRLLASAGKAKGTLVHPVKHRIRYELRIKAGHPRLRPGAKVRCWLPFPQEYRQQRGVRLIAAEPSGAVVAPSGHPQRTIYFEQTVRDPAKPPRFAADFEFTTYAYCPRLDPAKAKPGDAGNPLYAQYTAERPPHIVFTPELRETVRQIVGGETNPLLRARRIFRWVCDNIDYCSEMEYSTIRNISAKAFTTRRGDCGVQGLLFITLCRAAGIPARWQSGWETLPNGWNMHDWCEFYVEPWGWLPADPSYGLQKHEDPAVVEFYCGHMDAYRMIINLDYARELHPPKTSFRSEPNDFQRGEVEIDGHNLYFDEWSWDFDVDTMPLNGGMAALDEVLDAVVPEGLSEGNIPGAVIAVGHKTSSGYERWQKAYGFQRIEPRSVPMRADAIFDLASMTKPIATGTSLMVLVDEGRLSVEDPVGKYLPEFKGGDKRDITIRHLMTHMSGLPPYVGAAGQKVIKEKAGFPCRDETRACIRGIELARPPGEAVVYSCLNAIVCAEIVEAVTGEGLDQFAASRVFRPLKMIDTGFNPLQSNNPAGGGAGAEADAETRLSRIIPTTRTDYARGEGGFLQGTVHDPLAAMQAGVSGNAGLFSTVADLSRFAEMILNGGELDGVRVLKDQTIHQMTSVQNPGARNAKGRPDRRGLLWDLYVPDPGDTGVDSLPAFGHMGYTGTAIRFYPEQGVYIIALTNRVHPDDSGKVGGFRSRLWDTIGQVLLRDAIEKNERGDFPATRPSGESLSVWGSIMGVKPSQSLAVSDRDAISG